MAVSHWIKGNAEPDLATIAKIAAALGVPMSDLISGQESLRVAVSDALQKESIQIPTTDTAEETAQMPMVRQRIDRLIARIMHAPDQMTLLKKLHDLAHEELLRQEEEIQQKHHAGSKVA